MSKTRDTGKVLTAAGGLWLHPDDPAEAPGILDAACAGSCRSTAAITKGRTWRSTRVPSDLYRP